MPRTSARSIACALVLAALAAPAAAQVHRWVDEQGRVHYGDRPLAAQGSTLRIRAELATAPTGQAPASQPAARPAARPVPPARPAASGAAPSSVTRPQRS